MHHLVKQLSGHSGCKVFLIKNADGTHAVRKVSSSEKYNRRLKAQCLKQSAPLNKGLNSPKVMRTFYEDGLFGFDMEFVEGMTLAEKMALMNSSEIPDFIERGFVFFENEKSRFDSRAKGAFEGKIESLSHLKKSRPLLDGAFGALEKFPWESVPHSLCHGDLTLENIIITPSDEIYLIDFLDSFYDSWVIDAAKVFQDLELKWSYRFLEPDKNRDVRLFSAKEKFKEQICRLPDGKNLLLTCYHVLLLNMLRIYPYARGFESLQFLDSAVKKLLNKIENGI